MAYVYINPYKSSYLAAVQELQQRSNELKYVTQRIAQLKETIKTLEPLANEDGAAPAAGIAELCRQVLMSQPGCGFTAGQVIEHLARMGVDISGYANPLAVIHTTLTRLVRPGNGFVKALTAGSQPLYVYDTTYMNDVYRSGMRG